MFWSSGGSKSRLAKAAGAEPFGQIRDQELHVVVVRSTCRSQMSKAPHARSTFRSKDVEKVHGAVARSTFGSQNVKNSAFGALLEVEMLKKGAALWREAHFEAKNVKKWQSWNTFRR